MKKEITRNELGEIAEQIPLPQEVIDSYKADRNDEYNKKESWKSAEAMAKSLQGITPNYESWRNHYLSKSGSIESLKAERLTLIRALQDYGVPCSKTMTHEAIQKLIVVANQTSPDSTAITNLGERIKALDVAVGVQTQEQSRVAALRQEASQRVGNWLYFVNAGYYVTWYAPKGWALLYSNHGDREYFRVICPRQAPSNGYEEQTSYTAFAPYGVTQSKSITRSEFDKLVAAKPNWKQLINAYDLQSVQPTQCQVGSTEFVQWKWDFSNVTNVF